MLRKLIVFALTSGLAAQFVRHVLHRRQQQRMVASQRSAIRRWEDDGGATIVPRYSRDAR